MPEEDELSDKGDDGAIVMRTELVVAVNDTA